MMFLLRKSLGLMCLTAMVLFATGLAMTASAGPSEGREAKRSMTGVWVSNSPASWVVRYEGGTLAGGTLMRWELEEDENGLISGFNIWHSPLPEVGVPQVGAYCMVGARNGSNVVISEAGLFSEDGPLLPTFEFECKRAGRNKARCLGNGFSSQPPVALTGNMRRLRKADPEFEAVGIVIDEVRDFCTNGLP